MINLKKPLKIFGIKHKNEKVIMNSQSGGAFFALASYFLDRGGVVYGCGMNADLDADYCRITSIDELYKIQGSKYVQAHVKEIYPQVRDDLDDGRIVLFSGTPCYVNAVIKIFENHPNRDLLYTVDLICHGVPSRKIYREYLHSLEKKESSTVLSFIFRDKNVGARTHGKDSL